MIHILHIVNDFGGTEVYKNLYQHLDKLGIKQTIFVPLNPRVRYRQGNHDFEFQTEGSKIIYSITQKWFHRFLYNQKIHCVVKDLIKKVNLDDVNIIHTATLCMTGAVAFEINKKTNIPYVVSVRNTDINTYFKRLWWKKKYFYSILLNTKKVIFISPQYKKNCFSFHFNERIVQKIQNKTEVIPNGIDSYFIDNRINHSIKLSDPINIVFAGGFKNNKNLFRLIKAVDLLKEKGFNLMLIAIGKSLPNRKVSVTYINLLEKEAAGKDYVQLVDYLQKEDLCEIYKEMDIFAMPSIHETFGLSYAEALSQGLPIVYTKGQGFDGFYDEGIVGYSVNALSIEDIANGIEKVISNYSKLVNNINKLSFEEDFHWRNIALRYMQLYHSILENKVIQ